MATALVPPGRGESAATRGRGGGVRGGVAELDPPVELLITPEGSMSGYFVEGGVRDVAVTAGTLFRDLATRHEAGGGAKRPIDVAGGVYEMFPKPLFNPLLYPTPRGQDAGGKHRAPKGVPPAHGVFGEK